MARAKSLAFYRLPYTDRCTCLMSDADPIPISSMDFQRGEEGFIIAPFCPSDSLPILLIKPDKVETMKIPAASSDSFTPMQRKEERTSIEEIHYKIDYANFHAHIINGEFQKLVLSRMDIERKDEIISCEELFIRACRLYPRMFIALTVTPISGTWLVASPEVFLDGVEDQWTTMALAGTMRYAADAEWNTKDRTEQQLVSTYITECLERFTNDFTEKGPYTVRAADLIHLRSDYQFRLRDISCLGELIKTLYPTPAICGLPKQRALQFILNNEYSPRRYYSGFMGPFSPHDGHTHLYVSLRCMEIMADEYHLYAGSGILADSEERTEWAETEMKLETMRRLLGAAK